MPVDPIESVKNADWPAVETAIRDDGYARLPAMLSPDHCRSLTAQYGDDARFRSRIDMARYRFGVGDYAYFAEPLPELVADLREALYASLAPVANGMTGDMGSDIRYPATLGAFRRRCRAVGQTKPTPLLLRYAAGGYNCLHRDLYGDLAFPLQAVAVLSARGADYEGGEFLLVENRARQQARGEALALEQGELLIFPVFERPVPGKRGFVKAAMRHGVSRLRSGERFALGIIFHDAA